MNQEIPIADISVIVPVFNRADILTRTLDSIAAQVPAPKRIIIVDNNSSDDSRIVAMQWAERQRLEGHPSEFMVLSETVPGACAARNKGLEQADTLFTLFFDSDDVMRPDLLGRLTEKIESHPDADIFYWKADLHQGGKVKHLKFKANNLLVNHIHHALLSTQRFAARTDLFRRAGGWDASLPAWNDWELGIRLILNAKEAVAIPETLVDIYHQDRSITGSDFSSRSDALLRSLSAAIAKSSSSPLSSSLVPRPSSLSKSPSSLLPNILLKASILAGNFAREKQFGLARNTLDAILASPLLTPRQKKICRLAFLHTARGLRGAASLFHPLL